MIKAVMSSVENDDKTLVLGLSFGNLTRLRQGMTIPIDLDALAVERGEIRNVLIMYGETEADIVSELEQASVEPLRAQ